MLKDMIAFKKEMEKLVKDKPAGTDWNRELTFFNIKLIHLQHERLLHLIVTLAAGIAGLISWLATLFYAHIYMLIIDITISGLFIAYLIYYRRLENFTQNTYQLLDQLKERQPATVTKSQLS